jgi:peptide/nickel transport system permease protein
LIREIAHFAIFILCLSILISIITTIRSQDKSFLYAESSLEQSDILELANKTSYVKSFVDSMHSLFFLDFGKTESGESVSSHIGKKIFPTIQLSFFAIFLGSVTSISTALACIYFDMQVLENFFLFLSRLILSTPIFVVSILLFLFFFLYLGVLPPGGYEPGNITYLILPGIALGSRVFARIFYISLDEGKKEIDSDYFFFLQTRGIGRARIVFYYIFRKILPLLLIFILIDFSSLLSGSILVEEIFFFPGIGKSLYYAVKSLDENLLRALLFYSGIVFYILTRIAKNLQFRLSME